MRLHGDKQGPYPVIVSSARYDIVPTVLIWRGMALLGGLCGIPLAVSSNGLYCNYGDMRRFAA